MRGVVALFLMFLLGCVDQPTQVLVRLATDIPDIDTIVIRIYDDEGGLVREQVLPPDRLAGIPGDGRFYPIGTFGLVPQDGDTNRRFRVVIDVTVRREGTVRFETRARSGFVKNNTIRLDIFIAELCIDLAEMCEEEGLTCGIDGCVPEDIPPESLPPIDDDPIPDDPIDPRRHDTGVRDVGVDGFGVDAPPVDASFDAATDTMGIDVGFFDAGQDTGIDAPFDGGVDAGFDAGPLIPGTDDAPILFPWSGFRFEGIAKVVFRAVPGATRHSILYRDFGGGGSGEMNSFDPGPIVEFDITDVVVEPGGRRVELQVLSCTGDFPPDCSPPAIIQELYVDVGRVRCDLNNDRTSDVIVAQPDGLISVWINGAGSAPETIDAHSTVGATVTACADIDGDGDAEIVSMQSVPGMASVVDRAGSLSSSNPFAASATTIVAGDFDSDGFEDVVFADVNAGAVRYARGAPGPTLMASTPIARDSRLAMFVADPAGRYGRDLAVTDVDGDGFLDVIIADADHRDVMSKRDSGLQISYGGPTPFARVPTFVHHETAGEHFGWRVAGVGVGDEGGGGFVVAAPEGGGGTGLVYEYRAGAGLGTRTRVAAPDAPSGFCCFPNDLAPAIRDYGTSNFRYWVGYGDYETAHHGRVYECTMGSCVARPPPAMVVDAYFGFDVIGELDGDRMAALGRAGSLTGMHLWSGSWSAAVGPPPVTDLTRLAD